MKLEIDWLQKKWNLPDGATNAVADLFAAHEKGSTACKVEAAVSEWGNAVEGPASPLVLVEQNGEGYLQTRWFFEAEKQIAARLLEMNAAPARQADEARLKKYFPEPGGQREAAALALERNLAVITGGPGTGKTYTLARLLAILLESADLDPRRIQLAAPTGKAADRMKEAVNQSLSGLDEKLKAKLESASGTSKTIHSLLGHHPGRNACAFHAGRRLPCEILIVDECSMIDTLLWRALLEALPGGCKLILLGDPNQLESVGRGSVFSVIARAPSMQSAHVRLTESHRFSNRPAIAEFALAIEKNNAAAAMDLLKANTGSDCERGLFWNPATDPDAIFKALPSAVRQALESAAFAETPAAALEALGKVRLLTAHRNSIRNAVEEQIEKLFPGRRLLNRPLIIDRNDPETGLRNGEAGVLHFSPGKSREVFFENRNTPVPLSKLPDHSPAWAITIHRSQGSEYDNVVVLLPRKADSPLATRELLYTAITRAKTNLFVFGPADVIEKAIANPAARTTLLARQLESAGRL